MGPEEEMSDADRALYEGMAKAVRAITPFVHIAQFAASGYQAATGYDAWTGRELSAQERIYSGLDAGGLALMRGTKSLLAKASEGGVRESVLTNISESQAARASSNIDALFAEEARSRKVWANIAESQAARASSNIEGLFASEAQLRDPHYGGMDPWSKMIDLPKGSTVFGGIPGQSRFYTDWDTVVASKFSRTALAQSLQVMPNPSLGYRPAVGIYKVLKDVRVPGSSVIANPKYGPGLGSEFFIGPYQQYLEQTGFIRL
jgi:hypothetical protein